MNRNDRSPVWLAWVLVSLPAVWLAGCSGNSGPKRYDVSGNVTFNGKPIPAGEVTFEPDASKGNTGPGCMAIIEKGRYKTDPKKGVVGGPYLIYIVGFDGIPAGDSSVGSALFQPYELRIDLPKESTTKDIDVPLSAPAAVVPRPVRDMGP